MVLVALFFALPLLTTPVYADDTIEEPGTGAGSEWSGEIVDPTPAPAPAPAPEPQPTPAPATPRTAPKTTPKATPVVTPVVEEAPAETPEETPVETPVEETPEEPKEQPKEETKEETPEVPKTSTPAESEESIKNKIIALITATASVLGILLIWAVAKLYQITKFEKIYKEALKKSREVKKANINRAG